MVREEEASSEMDLANKSESEVSPDGIRIDGSVGVNATCLENEGNVSGVQVLSDVAFIEEDISPCNVSSGHLGRVQMPAHLTRVLTQSWAWI
ncbi:hypothetical protein PVK06_018117 [Gossypium arboreum]|uniref:Uncharacterized protein n=1 Tax=Gossypium arboreum TaxID=29729 RepID=A0ABR0Q4K3_GOSAR|nr:hypothetical protein PVK06_018117 [Gossypium arboreum]